jgi:hypothetical protein
MEHKLRATVPNKTSSTADTIVSEEEVQEKAALLGSVKTSETIPTILWQARILF